MNFPDSIKENKVFYADSLSAQALKSIPSIDRINTTSWGDNIEKELKNAILYPFVEKEDTIETDSLSNSFIVSYDKSHTPVQEKKNTSFQVDYFFIFFIFLLIALAMLKLQSKKTFSSIIKSVFNAKYSSALSREGDFFKSRAFICVVIYSFLSLGLILYSFFGDYLPVINEGLKILYLILGVSLLYLIKILTTHLLGVFFDIKILIIKYIHQILFANYYIGIFIFPLAFIYHYFPYAVILYLALLLLCLLFIHKIIKGFFIFRPKFQTYEIFLYFCTIEILPILLIAKFLSNSL